MRLQLYRGLPLDLIFKKRLGSPLSVSLFVGSQMVMHASPSDFIALQQWLEKSAVELKSWMTDPEHEKEAQRQAENLRGDMPD